MEEKRNQTANREKVITVQHMCFRNREIVVAIGREVRNN